MCFILFLDSIVVIKTFETSHDYMIYKYIMPNEKQITIQLVGRYLYFLKYSDFGVGVQCRF